MKKKILYIVLGVLAAVFFINILRPDKAEYGSNAEVIVPKKVETISKSIKDVTFIIDNSTSMRGYVDFSGNLNQFKDAKKSLIAKTGEFMGNCEKKLGSNTIAICNKKEYKTNEALQSLSNYSAFSGPITEIDKIISLAISKADNDSSLSIIVSDMIPSYGKRTLIEKSDIFYNLHNLTDIKTNIKIQLQQLKNDGKSIMIAQYEGDFNGKYYYNYTENITKNVYNFKDSLMENRPFYFVIFGNSTAIKDLCNNKCLPLGYKKIFASFGMEEDDTERIKYSVSQPSSQPQWILGNPNSNDLIENIFSISSNKNIQSAVSKFTFAFERFELPIYVSDEFSPVFDKNLISSVSELRDNSSFDISTCAYDKLPKSATIQIKFTSPRYDKEFKSSSTLDDVKCTLSEMKGRTWGFEAIIEAIYEAYDIKESDVNDIVTLEFKINKK